MHVWKVGFPGHADQAERLACFDPVAQLNPDRALLEMAVLGFPAVAVVDDHAVAGLLALDLIQTAFADPNIGFAVADSFDHAGGGRQDRHPGLHRR